MPTEKDIAWIITYTCATVKNLLSSLCKNDNKDFMSDHDLKKSSYPKNFKVNIQYSFCFSKRATKNGVRKMRETNIPLIKERN